jgi:pimeloyl-ACP methyl ester carboxylesterase
VLDTFVIAAAPGRPQRITLTLDCSPRLPLTSYPVFAIWEARVMDVDLILIHGFWSSPATWDRLASALRAETDLSGLRIHHFGYKSPRLRLPLSPARIPDYDDIAQS